MPQIKQGSDGTFGIQGKDDDAGAFIVATAEWVAASVDKVFFVADRAVKVKAIRPRVTVAGTDAGAVNATVRKVPSGTAIASGTALHSGTINLKGTADTNQSLTLDTTAGVLDLAAGDALAIDFSGTLTAATGAVSVHMLAK